MRLRQILFSILSKCVRIFLMKINIDIKKWNRKRTGKKAGRSKKRKNSKIPLSLRGKIIILSAALFMVVCVFTVIYIIMGSYDGLGLRHNLPGNSYDMDAFYKEGLFDKIVTTNLIYQSEELKRKPYYLSADMSRFLAMIIDSLNHDIGIGRVMSPTEKIQVLTGEYNQGKEE